MSLVILILFALILYGWLLVTLTKLINRAEKDEGIWLRLKIWYSERLIKRPQGLARVIAGKEAEIKALEVELEDQKGQRTYRQAQLDKASGWFAKESARTDLKNINRDIDFTMFKLTIYKAYLAEAKAKLEGLE